MTQLDRIEAKLDQLLEALADEGEEESDTVEVRSLDGSTTQVPRGRFESISTRGEGQNSKPSRP